MSNVVIIDRSSCVTTHVEVNDSQISEDGTLVHTSLRLTGINLSPVHNQIFMSARKKEQSFLILSPSCVISFTGTIVKVGGNTDGYFFVSIKACELNLALHSNALRDYKLTKLLEDS